MKRRPPSIPATPTRGVQVTGTRYAAQLPPFDPDAWEGDDLMAKATAYAAAVGPTVGATSTGEIAWAAYWRVAREDCIADIKARLDGPATEDDDPRRSDS